MCVLSPDLFSLYAELIMKNVANDGLLKANDHSLSAIRYADDKY